jgi:hypothetical protein
LNDIRDVTNPIPVKPSNNPKTNRSNNPIKTSYTRYLSKQTKFKIQHLKSHDPDPLERALKFVPIDGPVFIETEYKKFQKKPLQQ